MKSYDELKYEIEILIEKAQTNNRKYVYLFSQRVASRDANEIKKFFESKNFKVDITSCPRKLYDFVIALRN